MLPARVSSREGRPSDHRAGSSARKLSAAYGWQLDGSYVFLEVDAAERSVQLLVTAARAAVGIVPGGVLAGMLSRSVAAAVILTVVAFALWIGRDIWAQTPARAPRTTK